MSTGGKKEKLAHIVAVNMGYGHERPARTMKSISVDRDVIIANNYEGIPESDKKVWEGTRSIYEKISRLKRIPLLGGAVFGIMDRMQEIPPFYPKRDLSGPSLQLREYYLLIKKRHWMRHLIESLSENPVPIFTTFPSTGFAAEEFGYPNDIYTLCTDADISRAWAPKDPKKSRIKYLAPNGRVVERLQLYGVLKKNIELVGFPLPMNAIGGPDSKILIKNLSRRICHLDPNGLFMNRSYETISARLGVKTCQTIKRKKIKPVHLAFAVGGAGAQKRTAIRILRSLSAEIKRGKIIFTLIAGSRYEVSKYFEDQIELLRLKSARKKGFVRILFSKDRAIYFNDFAKLMNEIDILWTKPSELSFYTGLGLPIIMAPTIGSQEDFNREWLRQIGGGIDQLNPDYTNEWLFDWIESGALARMAWHGFIEAPTHGAYRIADIIAGRPHSIHPVPLVV